MLQGPLLAGGRVNVFMRSHSYAPNLDIELYHYGLTNKLFMYVNLVPRRSLVRFPQPPRTPSIDVKAPCNQPTGSICSGQGDGISRGVGCELTCLAPIGSSSTPTTSAASTWNRHLPAASPSTTSTWT
jgi:hypothetical protein